MSALPERTTDAQRRGYSDEEISSIYELGKFFIENGQLKQAETIFQGLIEVAPDFLPGLLGLAYVQIVTKNTESALSTCEAAMRVDGESCESMLFLVTALLAAEDYQAAGTYLGEVNDRIEGGKVDNPNVVRFFKAQMARFQNR